MQIKEEMEETPLSCIRCVLVHNLFVLKKLLCNLATHV